MPKSPKQVDALTHDAARRINVPTAEMAALFEQQQEIMGEGERAMTVRRPRPLEKGGSRDRDADLDPQIVWNGVKIRITQAQMRQLAETGELELGDAQLTWRGKDSQDWSDLVVNAPPIYRQEAIHPKHLIDDLRRMSERARETGAEQPNLFADFNGIADPEARAEFYQHAQHWTNRFILGDSLQVMASLAEREAMRGKVQCIYFDPPYGIKFNSNWQVSTLSRDVKDGKKEDVSREPEQVKAFRDTWKDGIHSYLTYLRDRLMVARELLTESGSIFVQIGDENVHRVRAVMDEVFGEECFVANIVAKKKGSQVGNLLEAVNDHIVWFSKAPKASGRAKVRPLFLVRNSTDLVTDFPMVDTGEGQRISLRDLEALDGIAYREDPERLFKTRPNARLFALHPLKSGGFRRNQSHPLKFWGRKFPIGHMQCWKHTVVSEGDKSPGMTKLYRADRLFPLANDVRFIRFAPTPPALRLSNWWDGLGGAAAPIYVVQSSEELAKRCILMTTDPGDLVLDPTCGSGTTATVAEQWGRRWITIDTSRVALALARTRLMSARYPYYLLADSAEGRAKEQEVSGILRQAQDEGRGWQGDIRQGFVYERTRWNTSGSIANNAEIDVIWEKWQAVLEPLRAEMNALLFPSPRGWGEGGSARSAETDEGSSAATPHPSPSATPSPTRGEGGAAPGWAEWEIPRDLDQWLETKEGKAWARNAPSSGPSGHLLPAGEKRERDATAGASSPPRGEGGSRSEPGEGDTFAARLRDLHTRWWEARIARQKEIDASIARAADVEMLYDRPYEDKGKVRVAGPFTVESLSPHRVVTARDDTLAGEMAAGEGAMQRGPASQQETDFGAMVLEHLRSAGVHGQERRDTIRFNSVEPWPGNWLAAEGRYVDGDGREKRAGILIGPEFGTLTRSAITAAAREASEARFDALIACAFNFEAQASGLDRLGPLPILKARMNPDLHMAEDLKNTGKGNLFVVFGEPDIDLIETAEGELQVKVNGVDVFDPATGEIRSDDARGIAAWFIDTDYNEESFFVRHAYFLGANDPYKSLKTALKAEIDEEAWATLYSDTSRPFPRPQTGRIAVKVINHFGDEVLKVFGV